MLDPKFIKENLELVREGARKKKSEVDIDRWVLLDDERKKVQLELDEKRAQQNKISKEIGNVAQEEREKLILGVGDLKKSIQILEEELKTTLVEWDEILMNIPNPPSEKMPEGDDDDENVTIKVWGEKPKFDFKPKEHSELGKSLDIIDVAKAAEVSGSRFYYLKGDLVLMQFAMTQFVFETLTNRDILEKIIKENNLSVSPKPFIPMIPPVMVRKEVQRKIHRVFGEQTYSIEKEDLNLVASAEHTLAPYHMNEVLDESELPKRYIGISTAFRREAGTYGKDMGGIFRAHQFDKSEMESFTTAESGEQEQKFIVSIQEYLMQQLNIPYRLQQVCTGDTGKPDYQQFDIEAWMPGQDEYRETHTSDYMTDFQTRGINSFYKTKDGKKKLLHTNDATAFAGRPMVAIMENFQTKEGEIIIPKVLRKWMGGKERIKMTSA